MQYKNKKNLYKIVFITILLGFIISLVGCNWLSFGLLNIFDPQAQVRIDFNPEEAGEVIEGCFNLSVYSINEVEFFIEGFSYDYYGDDYNSGKISIPELSRDINASFYVKPSSSPGTPGDATIIENIPLYVQEVADYVAINPYIVEVNCDIDLIGVDGSGHNQTISIVSSLPILEPGIDLIAPVAVINVNPGTTGTEPFTVIFDAYSSTDDRGIASYAWDFGDGTTATGVMPDPHTYTESGSYIVKLTVTDYFENEGIAFVTITVGEAGAPTAVINTTPDPPTGIAPFTVYFDASQSSGCCSIVSYDWNFGDGTPNGSGMTISHTYAVGTHIVVLTVTDSNGNHGYDSVTITVNASGLPSSITLQANPDTVNAGGGDSTIIAYVEDAVGNPVTNGTVVNFSTNLGSLSSNSETTLAGIATTVLTLSNPSTEDTIYATVTAISSPAISDVTVTCPPTPAP